MLFESETNVSPFNPTSFLSSPEYPTIDLITLGNVL
jgi:hypothetical protein